MKKVIYLGFFCIYSLNAFTTHNAIAIRAHQPFIVEEFDEEALAYDEFDSLADKQIAEGYKSSIGATNKGLLGWMALQVRKAGTSVVVGYMTASQWLGWFKEKAALAWLWLKGQVTR